MAADAASDARPRKLILLPDEPLREAVTRAIGFGLQALRREQGGATAGEVEPVHQYRVALRRLRAAVELFASLLYANQVRMLRRDLSWATQQGGALRECDVIGELMKDRARKIEPGLAKSVSSICNALAERRKAEHARFVETLRSQRCAALVTRLGSPALRKLPPDMTLGANAARLLRPMLRAVTRAGANLDEDATVALFHRLRVRVKRLRYALEMLSVGDSKQRKKMLARLENLQELLGDYNDTAVAIANLHTYASSPGAPAQAVLAAGALIQSLARRQRKLARQCLKASRRFERSSVTEGVLLEIRANARRRPQAEALTENAA